MNFGRVRDGLEQMSGKNRVAVEDVLDLFYDFCEDVREETGRPVDQLELHDENALMRRLPWAGNTFVKIFKSNKDNFNTQSGMKILQVVENEVNSVIHETEAAADIKEQVRKRQEELQNKKNSLQQTLRETEESRRVCANIQSEIDKLEREIDPVLKDRIRELK